MNIECLQGKLRKFARDRHWEQYHTPKNISHGVGLSTVTSGRT